MEATLNGNRVYYEERGDPAGVPVVLIHAFPFSTALWSHQIEALAAGCRVIAYDVRGHGRSSAGDGQYTIELFADDLAALLDHLGVRKTVLCGLSMGGYIALRLAEREPTRVRALVLCDTKSSADDNEAKLKRAAALKLLKSQGVKAYADAALPALLAPRAFSENTAAVAAARAMMESTPAIGIGGALLALASRTDTTPSLSKIAVPVLLVAGEHDQLTPPSVMQSMRDLIPGSELRVIKNAGHLSCLEAPEEFNQLLLDFLKNV